MGCHSDTCSEKGRSIQGAEPVRRICFVIIYPDLHIWNGRAEVSEGEADLYSSVSSINSWWERSSDWLDQKEAEYTKWTEFIPQQSPRGKSGVKEKILLHLRLLLVSYLTGKNRARPQILKMFLRWVRRMLWSIMLKSALRARMEIKPDSEAARR